MKKEINPAVAVVVIVVILVVAGFLYYQRTASPPAQPMSPQGPGAMALKKAGGDMSKVMTPAEKEMMQRSMANHGGAR
jgi:hypothetical protein